jgi:predicted O-linked N-acetylglucosamine transferase (SPINDLY family)
MSGLSYHHRFPAMASRCAPVQVHYMNHAGPICVPNVDYILADEISAPPGIDIHYPEKIYRLPIPLFGFDRDESQLPPIAPPPHLKNGFLTFGFFGGSEKLNEENLRLWADMLLAVPDARLVLQGPTTASHRAFVGRRFRSFGVDAKRLTILPTSDWQTLLANYARVDVSLDTWPYCGANTIADSVYQGVPVMTLKGDKFASAYGAGQVAACGLEEFIATSKQGYIEIARSLSRRSERLVELRSSLRQMVRKHGYGDSRLIASHLESAYLDMYRTTRQSIPS